MSIRVQTTINHISIRFATTILASKKMFFFRARVEQGIEWHASSVVWTLIYHSKLASQIARLAAIVVKWQIECSLAWYKVLSTTIRIITVVKMLWTHDNTRRSRVSPQQILTTVMTRIVVDKTIYHAKPHSICFLPQYQRNEIFVLTIENTDSDWKVHALHYANELLLSFRLFQKLLQTRLICRNNSKKKMLEKREMTHTHYR